MNSEVEHVKRLRSRTSFNIKNSAIRLNESGNLARPHIKTVSTEKDKGMSDKLHSLMESYLPKDIPSIQKQ